MLDPYHYVRIHPGGEGKDHLIVGGADHKSGEADDGEIRLEAVEAWIRNLIPALGKVTHRWSGQVMDTLDYSAFIGLNPGDRCSYVATGDSGQGITHGAVAGILLSRLMQGDPPPWAKVYDPARTPAKSIGTFISENVAAVKHFAEYVAPGEVSSADEIKPGHGAILRSGLSKIAAWRDDKGELFLRSAACTHLGCHLHWNSLERCWDCPCHGSQFSPDGAVLNGPAIFPLPEAKIE